MYSAVIITIKHIALNNNNLYKNLIFLIFHLFYYGFIFNNYAMIISWFMMVLNLYKNGKLELSLNGYINNNIILFDNITYDKEKIILIREDETYKYIIDFNNNSASIELKEYGQILPLLVNNIEKNISDNKHIIKYNIESEDDVLNELEIIF